MTKKADTSTTRHWDALYATDPKHTKAFSRAGGFKGTAMKPIWIVKRLTEHFGPVGEGWGMGKPEFQVVDLSKDTGKVMVYCTVECWHTNPANIFYGVGGDTVQDQFRDGRMAADDEAFKKAFTDAVNNAFKFVGVGGDIHMGQFDDSKYVAQVREEFTEEPPAVKKLEEFVEAIGVATTEDDLKSLLDKYGADIDEANKTHGAKVSLARQVYAKRAKAIKEAVTENA